MKPFFLWCETKLTAGIICSYIRRFPDSPLNADLLLNLFRQGEIVYADKVDEMLWKKREKHLFSSNIFFKNVKAQ